jgi:hypothetical protein
MHIFAVFEIPELMISSMKDTTAEHHVILARVAIGAHSPLQIMRDRRSRRRENRRGWKLNNQFIISLVRHPIKWVRQYARNSDTRVHRKVTLHIPGS